MLNGFLACRTYVSGLHPGDVILLSGAHLTQLHEVIADTTALDPGGQLRQVGHRACVDERGEIAMQAAHQRNGDFTALCFREQAVYKWPSVFRYILDLTLEVLEDNGAQLLTLFHRAHLRGEPYDLTRISHTRR